MAGKTQLGLGFSRPSALFMSGVLFKEVSGWRDQLESHHGEQQPKLRKSPTESMLSEKRSLRVEFGGTRDISFKRRKLRKR